MKTRCKTQIVQALEKQVFYLTQLTFEKANLPYYPCCVIKSGSKEPTSY